MKNLSSKLCVASHPNALIHLHSSGLFAYAINYIFTCSFRKKNCVTVMVASLDIVPESSFMEKIILLSWWEPVKLYRQCCACIENRLQYGTFIEVIAQVKHWDDCLYIPLSILIGLTYLFDESVGIWRSPGNPVDFTEYTEPVECTECFIVKGDQTAKKNGTIFHWNNWPLQK